MNMSPDNPKKTRYHFIKAVFQGVLMLGGGKEEGIQLFPSTTNGVLNALAPWFALVLVNGFVSAVLYRQQLPILMILSMFLVELCCLLVCPVIIHFYSKLWNRENLWKRTVSAYLWCQWLPFLDLLLGGCVILFMGFSANLAITFLALLLVLYMAYALWIQWFVVKIGLQINNLWAIVIVVTTMVVGDILFSIFLLSNSFLFHQMQQALTQAQAHM